MEELNLFPNILVYRNAAHEIFEIGKKKVAIVYLPYYSVTFLADNYATQHADEELDPGLRSSYATMVVSSLIQRELEDPAVQAADLKVLVGHYAIAQAQTSSLPKMECITRRFMAQATRISWRFVRLVYLWSHPQAAGTHGVGLRGDGNRYPGVTRPAKTGESSVRRSQRVLFI